MPKTRDSTRVDFQAGERLWVVTAPLPLSQLTAEPTAQGFVRLFVQFETVGRKSGLWVVALGRGCRNAKQIKELFGVKTMGHRKNERRKQVMDTELDEKHKFALYIRDSSLEVARQWYDKDNCKSISEFIEKAILFYGGFVASEYNDSYYPQIFVSTVKSALKDTEYQLSKQLFRMAVEMSIIKNILATNEGIKAISLTKLQGQCVEEVKKINGVLSTEEAIKWQS